MMTATFTVDSQRNLVQANTDNAAFQLFNESVVSDEVEKPLKKDTWYPINGSYGKWVLENEFPTFKGDEFITVKYL